MPCRWHEESSLQSRSPSIRQFRFPKPAYTQAGFPVPATVSTTRSNASRTAAISAGAKRTEQLVHHQVGEHGASGLSGVHRGLGSRVPVAKQAGQGQIQSQEKQAASQRRVQATHGEARHQKRDHAKDQGIP